MKNKINSAIHLSNFMPNILSIKAFWHKHEYLKFHEPRSELKKRLLKQKNYQWETKNEHSNKDTKTHAFYDSRYTLQT